ncbi:hypothetical protein AYI68_g3115 [Smittium mucronatum]|uniref:Uncharacterized protein n=1 Tax=Smittium mucronatum TaxID=133383 RepID=A0A1R0H0S6_9FUNG|nr:hypothetical protein AYI68_g3115 [Smittium mucronatum]
MRSVSQFLVFSRVATRPLSVNPIKQPNLLQLNSGNQSWNKRESVKCNLIRSYSDSKAEIKKTESEDVTQVDNLAVYSLNSVCEMISNKDTESLFQVLSNALFAKYKAGIDKNSANGVRTKLQINKVLGAKVKDAFYFTGYKESFDPSIPIEDRLINYRISILGNFFMGFGNEMSNNDIRRGLFITKELGMKIVVDISVNCELEHTLVDDKGKVLYKDLCTREVILSLSSPYYNSPDDFSDAFDQMSKYKYVFTSELDEIKKSKEIIYPEFSWEIDDIDYNVYSQEAITLQNNLA